MDPVALRVKHEAGFISPAWNVALMDINNEVSFCVVTTPHFIIVFIVAIKLFL